MGVFLLIFTQKLSVLCLWCSLGPGIGLDRCGDASGWKTGKRYSKGTTRTSSGLKSWIEDGTFVPGWEWVVKDWNMSIGSVCWWDKSLSCDHWGGISCWWTDDLNLKKNANINRGQEYDSFSAKKHLLPPYRYLQTFSFVPVWVWNKLTFVNLNFFWIGIMLKCDCNLIFRLFNV